MGRHGEIWGGMARYDEIWRDIGGRTRRRTRAPVPGGTPRTPRATPTACKRSAWRALSDGWGSRPPSLGLVHTNVANLASAQVTAQMQSDAIRCTAQMGLRPGGNYTRGSATRTRSAPTPLPPHSPMTTATSAVRDMAPYLRACSQKPSEAVGSRHARCCHRGSGQKRSEATGSNQKHTKAIGSHLKESEALKSNRKPSEGIRSHHAHQVPHALHVGREGGGAKVALCVHARPIRVRREHHLVRDRAPCGGGERVRAARRPSGRGPMAC